MPFVKKTPSFPAIAILCLAATLAPVRARAAELTWSGTSGGVWVTGSVANWWDGSNDVHFSASNAVIFGTGTVASAQSGTVVISSSSGVLLGASGTNPGMIVTGTGDWEFAGAQASGTVPANPAGLRITGSGAGVRMEGTGTLTFSVTTAYIGATQIDAGALRLNVADAIAQSSGVRLAASAKLDLGGRNQALKALDVLPGANIVFSSTGTGHNTLTLGALTGDGGEFDLCVNVGSDTGDRIVITGSSEGAHTLRFTHEGTPRDDTSILVVSTPASAAAIFSGTMDAGAYAYQVERGANGSWYLNNSTQLSRIASAVVASAAAAGRDWHYELDALYKRMGELREPPDGGAASLWFRANAARVNADKDLTGYSFHQYSYGVTLGVDKGFRSGGSTWIVGAFGAMSRTDRDFNTGGDGKTKGTGGGLYLTWLYESGWFADFIGRADRNKNDISAITSDGYRATANYNNAVKGLSFELGRRLLWNEEWWFEPSVQYAIADVDGADYQADYVYGGGSSIPVSVRKAKASQARIALRVGEAGGSNPGWHPYAKVAFVYSRTSDGEVSVGAGPGARRFDADFDGARWEFGIGAAYVINARSQFYYDYEYARASHYTRPWAVNLGIRIAW